ncbi:MAG TPA: EAL domain-containing protein [Gallionella sp.]|nr:EAL domain-containing protein [Gallionella sp.]
MSSGNKPMHILPNMSRWSLHKKIVSIIMLGSAVCLFVGFAVLVASSAASRYEDSLHNLSGLADVLAENGQAALVFADQQEAGRLLASLKEHSEISSAWLVTGDGVVLSSWSRNGAAGDAPPGYRVPQRQLHSDFWSKRAELYSPVTKEAEQIGYVLLHADFTEQWNSQLAGLWKALGGAAVALVVVFLLAIRLQRVISRPIMELANAARAIAHDKTYEVRVPQRTHDEIGELVLAFNNMLSEIQERDEHLSLHRARLEEDVNRRTTELRTILENTPDTIARYDRDCRRIYVNPAFGALTDGGVAALLGKKPSEYPGGESAETYEAKVSEVLATGEDSHFELKWIANTGKEVCSHIRMTAERDLSGNIVSVLGVGRDITELNKSRSELNEANTRLENMNVMLQSLASIDSLTQLPNRRLLLDRLHQALLSSVRSGHFGAIMFIDLDNFKTLNDTLGHDIGDLLLQQVAKRLESCVREADTVARLGGDEFVVMLEELSEHALDAAAQTEHVGNKILAVLNQPYQLGAHKHQNTPSIGATLFNNIAQTTDELMKQADIAMYQAKRAGRNTLRFFDPQMQETVNTRAALEDALHNALANHEFQLYYQLQVGSSNRPLGAEALIRWEHPERGVVSPAQFIPLAEETGLILPIGQWVLETACAQLKSWQQSPLTCELVLAVNVSAKQFRQTDFVAQVKAVVQRHAIDPKLLKLELTESLLLETIEDTIATMNALNEIGVQFSLDDFGTGYSSLQYLKQLPLDQLKIDQSFVRDLVTDSSDKAIVRTIIAMANSLGLNVIAEGVETEEQRERLQGKGCAHYQGYLFGKPLPIGQFETLLKQS